MGPQGLKSSTTIFHNTGNTGFQKGGRGCQSKKGDFSENHQSARILVVTPIYSINSTLLQRQRCTRGLKHQTLIRVGWCERAIICRRGGRCTSSTKARVARVSPPPSIDLPGLLDGAPAVSYTSDGFLANLLRLILLVGWYRYGFARVADCGWERPRFVIWMVGWECFSARPLLEASRLPLIVCLPPPAAGREMHLTNFVSETTLTTSYWWIKYQGHLLHKDIPMYLKYLPCIRRQ